MRGLAGHDPDQFPRILTWALDDALFAWRERILEALEDEYRWVRLEHAAAGAKSPRAPAQLVAIRKELKSGR